ncbi:Para-hydroxybenzoate-polyprenyltransferase [Phytophthora megakarya]|uniref:4-hydroxybenzoate polyprenyltransferase, mitochondrial n=1 Tax=Phytophthora megakarya TaxID=4795 RepID=A0A225VVR3_9STRA|nr:Para-hydroxybenzoate-polyprenyltransferase [Phytophthora megakarya]
MAARLLLSRPMGRPRFTPRALYVSFPPATRSGIVRLATAPSVSLHHPVSFASTRFAGIQTSWFSSSASPILKQDNEPERPKRLQPGVDAFTVEKDTWAERHSPEWLLPYIQISRINRPAGTFMLLWPCFWSISMAAPAGHLPDLKLLVLFGTGAFIMRSAGCTINDMWDKDFDKQVERTNKRPLAAGKLTYPQAWSFLAAQLSAGLVVLMQLNWFSVAMGASSLALVAAYPAMKRFTHWPQAFLGLTFNYGALLGWAAVHGSCEWSVVLPLYAGGVAWTLVYDTLYAHQDKKDDVKIGVRSTALLFGDKTKPVLNFFSAAAIGGFGAAGYMAGLDWPFYLGLMGGAAQLAWQVNSAKLDDPVNLQARFASNKWFGALMFVSVVAGNGV